MFSLLKTQFRLVAGFILLALALAIIPAASNALAHVPSGVAADTPGKQAPVAGSSSQGAQSSHQAHRPQTTGVQVNGPGRIVINKPVQPSDITLYDQYNNPGSSATNSQHYEAANAGFDDQLADDFTVCCGAGATWTVTEVDLPGVYFNGNPAPGGPARDFHVVFYNDASGLPGSVVADRDLQAYINTSGNFVITIAPNVTLGLGHYWMSVQANMDFGAPTAGQWGWGDRTVTSGSPAAWQNPGGGFGQCPAWTIRYNCVTGTSTEPDQEFRLVGTSTGSTPTPTTVPTNTPVPGCSVAGWLGAAPMPTPAVRAFGVWEPPSVVGGSGRFYAMGGRADDTATGSLLNPRYYDPGTLTWVVATAAFPDVNTSNTVCGDLVVGGVHKIYCVGGSTGGGSTASDRVAVYNPVADTMTTDDVWPGDADTITIPGGAAVANNKLYVLGGFKIGTSMSREIWQFDPTQPSGSRWVLKTGQVPDNFAGSNGLGYIPAATIGNVIYTGGGSHWVSSGSTIADDPTAFSYNTVSDTVDDATIPDLPAPGNAETRALAVDPGIGHLVIWVIGGGRTAPNPTTNVMQLDPANLAAGWTVANHFDSEDTTGRRNFPVDTNGLAGGSLRIYLAGGYKPGCCQSSAQIYNPTVPLCTPTVGPTNTTIPTSTPTSTPTTSPTPICPGDWTEQALYPAHVMDEAAVSLGGNIYSFGGVVTGTVRANAYKYNASGNTWTAIASLPGPRENPSAVTDGTFIYVLGGNDNLGNVTASLWKYDTVADTYITLTNALVATRAQTAAYLNGTIYKIGGATASAVTNDAEAYSISGGGWTTIATYPQSVGFPMSMALNGQVYVAGGEDGAVGITNTYAYSPTVNTWNDAAIADLPRDSWGAASDLSQGKWIIAGGFAPVNDDITQGVLSWNPSTNTWSPIDPMLQPRGRLSGAAIGTDFYAIGGAVPPFSFAGSQDNQRYRNICALGVVNGHLTWQGIAQPSPANNGVTVTLTLCNGASQVYSALLSTNNTGNFTANTSLPDGTYTWHAKGIINLGNSGSLTISGGSATLEVGLLRAGDSNNSNNVNATDFNIVKNSFGKAPGQPGYDDRANFNRDGVVNSTDFNLLKNNFGQAGASQTCP